MPTQACCFLNKISMSPPSACTQAKMLQQALLIARKAQCGAAHAAKLRWQHDLVLVGVPAIKRGRRRVAGCPEAQAAAAAGKADACASTTAGAKPVPGVPRRWRACAAQPRARRRGAKARPGVGALRRKASSQVLQALACSGRGRGCVVVRVKLFVGVPAGTPECCCCTQRSAYRSALARPQLVTNTLLPIKGGSRCTDPI